MITSADYELGDIIKQKKVDKTNGWWCEQCECYHPYDVYTKPTSTIIGYKLLIQANGVDKVEKKS